MISVGFGVVTLIAAVAWWWCVPRLRAWPPSLGLLVAVLTVVPPHQVVALGIGMDDVLFLLGLLLLLPSAIHQLRHAPQPVPFGWPLAVGTGLLVAGTTISAFVNADTAGETLSLLLRGPARLLLYVAMVVVVVAQSPRERTRAVVARALAGVGTFEAVFSVVAYTVGLPGGFGLEAAQGNTSLVGEIPGRVTGTLGLSPNFLGALLVLSIPVSLGLALDARDTRGRIGWAAAVVAQIGAVVLTYTRSSLGVVLLACVVLIGLRGRLRWLAAGAVVLVGLLVFTPAFDRIVHDRTDRMALYASAVQVFADHPFAGVGPGEQARFTAADPAHYRMTDWGVAGNNAHNTILLAAAEDGILGLAGAVVLNLALVVVAIAVIRRARTVARLDGDRRAEPLAVAVAVLAFLSQGMTNNLFTVTLTASALVMLVAGCALPWLGPAVPRTSAPRHALAASNEI
ncbi:MAG TPA: O-antigen ligase family protein [Actinopolymorphaceae bacterium]|nr:O-antigen ligase family protein [Actinopolymorphaceae bacterium]